MSSPFDTLLSRLDSVRTTGLDSCIARCPAHEDRSPSLAVRQTEDGKVLVHCYAGCSVHDVVGAVGMDLSDLFPPRHHHNGKPERRPFPAMDALRAVSYEALVVAAAGSALLDGHTFSPADRERLMVAVTRIQAAVEAVMPHVKKGGRHV